MSSRAVSAATAVMLCMGACLFAAAGPAGAKPAPKFGIITNGGNPQAGYPPLTSTTMLFPTKVTQTESLVINGHVVVEECGFFADTEATYSYSPGGSTGNLTADGFGCVSITIYAYDPHVTINGGPLEPANYQGNTIVVVGTGANTAQRTYTLTFNIVQPSSSGGSGSGNGSGTTSGSPGSSSGSGSGSGSGGSSSNSSSGSGSGSGSSYDPGSGSGSTGTLAFTGTNAVATAVAGLALMLVGGLLVLFTRRRRSSDPR